MWLLNLRSIASMMFGALVCISALDVNAQDWTRFRGPNGEGVAADAAIPVEITEDDYNWKITLPGEGHSSPVIWGDRVFLLSADAANADRHVICIDANSGETLWQNDFPSRAHRLHRRSSYASSSPAVDADHVYCTWAEPEQTTLIAFDHDGNKVWERNLGSFTSQHGYGASPIVYNDLLIMMHSQQADQLRGDQKPGQSVLLAVDRKSGDTVWETKLKTTRVCYSMPCVHTDEAGNESLVAYNTGNGIFGVNPESGDLTWEVDVFSMRTVASTLVADGFVLGSCGSGGGGNYLVAVKPGTSPQEVFRVEESANYVPTPIANDGYVYVFNDKGIVSCVELETGETAWRERVSDAFSGSPVRVEDRLYCIAEDGELFVLKASPDFEILSSHSLGELSYSTPAVSHGRMYLRTASHLISIGGK